MALFTVTLPASAGGADLKNGADGMLVAASNAAAALDVAKSDASSGEGTKWEAATAAAIVQGALTEYSLFVQVTPAGGDPVSFEAPAGEATLLALANALLALLNADTSLIDGTPASAVAGPPVVITVPADNNLGDSAILSNMRRNGVPVEGGWAMAVSAPGVAASARTLTFPDPASVTIPTVFRALRSR